MRHMKNLKNKICFTIMGLVTMMSCDDYLDVNTNPNKPTEVPIQLLMSQTSFRTGDNIQLAGNITSYYVQHLASPNAFGSKDIHDPQPYDFTWQELYRMMSDITDMEELAQKQGLSQYLGAAKVLKAVNLGLLLDLWGDAPYSQAFFAEYLQPEYDDDEVLYDEIINLLDEGIAEFNKQVEEVQFGEDDFIYQGDIDGWIKMAWSLKARYLQHMSNTPKYDASEVLAAVDQGIGSNAKNADISYYTAGPEVYNPWSGVARNQEVLILDGWISEQLADAMNGTTFGVVDPRMPYLFGATDGGEFIGVENGAGRGSNVDVSGDRSTLERNTYYASDDAPVLIITLAELKFIEAEAALANSDPARAYEAYLDGIAAHMEMVGVPGPEAQGYMDDPAVGVGQVNLTLDLIMKEKFVAMFLHPEAWADARRFDYQYQDMTLPANHNPALSGQFVRRLVYPDSELSRNVENVPSVSAVDRVWWDQ